MSIYQGPNFPGADSMTPVMRDQWAEGGILDMGKVEDCYLLMTRNFGEHTYPDVFIVLNISENFLC